MIRAMKDNVLTALEYLDVAVMPRDEWITVGMALKEEGYSCSVWDEWSRNDSRYKEDECRNKWDSFRGAPTPVKGGSIIELAKSYGWHPSSSSGDRPLDWNDMIEYDGDEIPDRMAAKLTPVEELKLYIETLFEPDDTIGYVVDSYQNEDGKWLPSAGNWDRTARQLLESLNKYPDDICATIGDYESAAGAWIRFNPLDGVYVKNENVTKFKYALVESDKLPLGEQEALIRRLELPVATLTYSGGKSIHAIVKVDAPNYDEYRKRVSRLYEVLKEEGFIVDQQNRNPSRLSRMPGIKRGDKQQELMAVNIGRKSWDDWLDFIEGEKDELPDIITFNAEYIEKDMPPLKDELIKGLLRKGHKCLLSSSSKAGKSFMLIEMAIALAEGWEWMSFKCVKTKVLYINLEIDEGSFGKRVMDVYDALNVYEYSGNLEIWNLRGKAQPLDKLVDKIVRRANKRNYGAIIIDPIYKVITGDENSAADMGQFCNQFDRLCAELGCSVIYCHHHSKGVQGAKRSIDRASGSGVFGRDPDAIIDMTQLELTDDLKNNVAENGMTAWRLEFTLREFAPPKPISLWFEYPIHWIDMTGELGALGEQGSPVGNLAKNKKQTTPESRKRMLDNAYDALKTEPDALISKRDLWEYLEITRQTLDKWLNENEDAYKVEKGIVRRVEKDS